MLAGMKSEQVAGFVSESMAGFTGIRKLADLAFKRRNVGLVLGNDAGLSLLIVQIAAIELR